MYALDQGNVQMLKNWVHEREREREKKRGGGGGGGGGDLDTLNKKKERNSRCLEQQRNVGERGDVKLWVKREI